MATLLGAVGRREFLLNLLLGACLYRVERAEYDRLPETLRRLVDEVGGGGGGDSGGWRREEGVRTQLQCLRLLCWASRLHDGGGSGRVGVATLRTAVGQLLVSLFNACFFVSHSRQTSHYCSRLIFSLDRSD